MEGHLLTDREECERGLVASIQFGMESSDRLVGFPGRCSSIGGGTQEAIIGLQSIHYSSSDGSGGLAAHGVDQMEFERERVVGASL